jgi:hypothetical protein
LHPLTFTGHVWSFILFKKLRKYKNNYDILKIYTMIKHVLAK